MNPTRPGVVLRACILSLALAACGDSKPPPEPDAGPGETPDAGTADAGTPDAGTSDAGTADAGTTSDAGTPDAGPHCNSMSAGTGGEARWQGLGPGVNAGNIYSRTDATADSAGNVLLVQHRLRPRPSNDDADLLLTKLSPDRQVLWQKAYGSLIGDGARDLRVDARDHIFLAGAFGYSGGSGSPFAASIDFGTGPLQAVAANEDGFVVKLAPDGTTVWATPVTCSEASSVGELALLPSGNVLVAGAAKFRCAVKVGEASLLPQGVNAVDYVAELDGATGQLVWGMGLPGPTNSPTFLPRLATGPAGEVFIAANDAGKTVVQALAADAARTQRWSRSLTGLRDVRIAPHADGGLYLVALFEGTVDVGSGPLTAPAGDTAFLVARLDAEGRTVAARVLGSANDIYGEVDDVEVDASGRLLLVGQGLKGPIDSGRGPLAVLQSEFAVLVERDLSAIWARGFLCSSPNGAGRRGDGVLVAGSLALGPSVDLGAGLIPPSDSSQSFAVQYGP
jgi:hypothetical protein